MEKSIARFNRFMGDYLSRDLSTDSALDILSSYFSSSVFYTNLFMSLGKGADKENSQQEVAKMYKLICKHRMIKLICTLVIEGCREDQYPRACAVLLRTITTILVSAMEDHQNRTMDDYVVGNLSRKGIFGDEDARDAAMGDVRMLQKCSRKIVKNAAKQLERNADLPRELGCALLCIVPEPIYIKGNQIGFYGVRAFQSIYSYVEEDTDSYGMDPTIRDLEDVNWTIVFGGIFGKDRILDVATCLTLEGRSHIDKYHDTAKQTWNVLTKWALYQLDHAPEDSRCHMVEMYIKRLSSMFNSKSHEIRVNLANLDSMDYPNLVKTISQYTDTIRSIIDGAGAIANEIAKGGKVIETAIA